MLEFDCTSSTGRTDPGLLSEISRLRLKVWRATGFEMRISPDATEWTDEADESAVHFCLHLQGGLVASARVHIYSSLTEVPQATWFTELRLEPKQPVAFLSRLVVDPAYQRRGLGTRLEAERLNFVRDKGARGVLCDVPQYRIEPMRRAGWTLIKEPSAGLVFPEVLWGAMYKEL